MCEPVDQSDGTGRVGKDRQQLERVTGMGTIERRRFGPLNANTTSPWDDACWTTASALTIPDGVKHWRVSIQLYPGERREFLLSAETLILTIEDGRCAVPNF
jgi:hypothetical protein